jgi:hypothetical protein
VRIGTPAPAIAVPNEWRRSWKRKVGSMMGHEDMHTTLIYADYAPNAQEVEMVDRAFAFGATTATMTRSIAARDAIRDAIVS